MDLQKIKLFKTLDFESIEYLKTISDRKKYAKDEIIFYTGENPKKLLIVSSGRVKIFKSDAKGNEITIGYFGAMAILAEMPTISQVPYPASAKAEIDCELVEIDIDKITLHIKESSYISQMIINSLINKIKNLESIVQYMTILNAKTKVATYLYANKHTLHKTTQREIATTLMLTPEGLSRILRGFKDSGIVEVRDKRLYILNEEKLSELTK